MGKMHLISLLSPPLQNSRVSMWQPGRKTLSSLRRGRGGLRPWGHGRPRVSVATGLDIDRPWLLLQRLTVHLPGQKKQLLGNCISRKIPHWNSSTRASNRDMWMLLHWQDNSKWKWFKKDTILNWRSREQDLPTGIKYKKWDFNERPFNKYPQWSMAFLVAQMVKNLPAMQQTWVWSLGQEDSWKRECYPLQYCCLENSMDREAWRATVRGVAKSQNTTDQLTFYTQNMVCTEAQRQK